MPRCGGKKALPSELSGVRDLCKLPSDKSQLKMVTEYLKDNRHYISVIASCAAELRSRFAPFTICIMLDIINGKPFITVSAESEEVDIQTGLEDFFQEFYDPISIDLGCIRFEAEENWASTRKKPTRLDKRSPFD